MALKCALGQWNGVVAEGPVKLFVEKHALLPEAWLVAEGIRHSDRAVDEAAAAHELAALAVGKEH